MRAKNFTFTLMLLSDVNQDFLKESRWGFYQSYWKLRSPEPVAWDALTDVREVWNTMRRNGLGDRLASCPLKLPSDWAVSHCSDSC